MIKILKCFSKSGLTLGNFHLSWILFSGLFISLASLVFVLIFLSPKNNGNLARSDEPNQNWLPEIGQVSDGSSGSSSSASSQSGSTNSNKKRGSTGSSSGSSGSSSASGATTLVALGDSITVAAGLGSSYSFATGTSLNSVYLHLKNAGLVNAAYNLASGGATSATVASSQAPNVNSYNPGYVTLLIGGNDMLGYLSGGGIPPSQFQSNLSGIASQITASGRKVLVGTIPDYGTIWAGLSYPPCAGYKTYPEVVVSAAISEYNSKISAVASQYDLTKIDLYSALSGGDILESDCLHPNVSGQQKIANRFIAGL